MNDRNSTELSLIDCSIKSLKDVPLKLNLQTINLHANKLIKIENLTYLQNLLHLDLSSNQINSLSGLEGLVSLQTLNLSCNRIEVIDGLHGLRKLTWLNLSFNKINYLNGLVDLHGRDYRLQTLNLHGNLISSVEEVTRNMTDLVNLEHLTLYDNPIEKLHSYRNVILGSLKQLKSLDSKDRSNRQIKNDSKQLPGFEEFEEFLSSSTDDSINFRKMLNRNHPTIDNALKRIEEASSSSISSSIENLHFNNGNENDSFDYDEHDYEDEDEDKEENTTVLQEDRLDKLEGQIKKLVSMKHILQNQIKTDTDFADNLLRKKNNIEDKKQAQHSENKKSSSKIPSIINKPFNKQSHTSQLPAVVGNKIFKTVKKDSVVQTDPDTCLTKKYNEEREKRERLENDVKQLNEKIEQLKENSLSQQINYEKTSTSNQNFQELFNKEKRKCEELSSKINHYQYVVCEMKRQIESYKEAQDSNIKTIRSLEENISRLNVEKSENDEKFKIKDASNAALKQDIDALKQTINTTQIQIQQLQELLINKDAKHKKDFEGYVNIHGDEVKSLIKNELEKTTQLHALETKQNLEKIDTLKHEYKALEDEFRIALVLESNRYNDVNCLYERANRDYNQIKQDLQFAKQREERDKTLISELNSLIKEQKSRLQELTKIRQDSNENVKKQNTKLEDLNEELRKFKSQNELLKKEKKDSDNRFHAVEALLDGLRQEKFLWSQELAQQGASLAQDRGRLEAQIQTMQSEIQTIKKHLEHESDNVRIKAKIIEDQTDTIKKLKDAVLERDDALRKCREESINMQKNLEKQINDEIAMYQDLQEKYNKSIERRDELKGQLEDSQEQFDKAQSAYNELSKKWKDKSELIDELDVKVRHMKDNYDHKEKGLIEEKYKLAEENKLLQQRIRHLDDDFRKQFDTTQRGHQESLDKLKRDYEKKLQESQFRVAEVEEEMRIILIESENTKKQYEEKIKKFSKMFIEFQNDLK